MAQMVDTKLIKVLKCCKCGTKFLLSRTACPKCRHVVGADRSFLFIMRGISCVCGQVKKPIVEGDEEELERRRSNDRCHEERDRDRSIRHREDLPPPPYTDVTQGASESVPKSSSSYAGSFHSRNDPGSSSVMDSLSSIYAAGAI